MLGGDEREALLRVADRLSIELGYVWDDDVPDLQSSVRRMDGILRSDDELLVARVRQALARLAATLERDGREGGIENAVDAALDGAELAVRGELVNGSTGGLRRLMPSLVFLVALPIVEQDRALELSRRTEELVEEEMGIGGD